MIIDVFIARNTMNYSHPNSNGYVSGSVSGYCAMADVDPHSEVDVVSTFIGCKSLAKGILTDPIEEKMSGSDTGVDPILSIDRRGHD